jgi:hypothetical protein
MSGTKSVDLPFVNGTETIGTAIDRLKEAGKSGVVAFQDRRFVVLDASTLSNSLIMRQKDAQLGDIAKLGLPQPQTGLFSSWRSPSETGLSLEQRNYAVTGVNGQFATVSTDARRANRLMQPTKIFDKL